MTEASPKYEVPLPDPVVRLLGMHLYSAHQMISYRAAKMASACDWQCDDKLLQQALAALKVAHPIATGLAPSWQNVIQIENAIRAIEMRNERVSNGTT